MKSNLFVKFYVAILLVISLILIFYGMINISDQKKSSLKIMETQASIISKSIVLSNVEAILSNDNAIIIENSLEFLKENKLVKYLIFNKINGEKILIFNNKWLLKNELLPEYKILQTEENKYKILKGSIYNEEVFHYTYPIKISTYNWGWFHIGFSLDEYNKNIERIYNNFLYITLISFLFSVFFTFLFAKWLVRPILKLTQKTKDIAHGNYEEIPVMTGKDEIYELTHNFNLMVRYLKRTREEVEKSRNELETKVKIRTKELKELNRSLDKKVQEEVIRRQKQEKYLHERSKMAQMGEMLNNIAHQWRQPLSVITTVTSAVKLKKDLNLLKDQEFDENYKLVMENANYLTKTIDTFSKYTEDTYNVEHVSLNDVIRDLLVLNSDILKKNFIKINLDLPIESTNIETIPNSLSHVLFNILVNVNNALSSKDNSFNKVINISLRKEDSKYFIDIEDNAGGINEKIIDKIFEPYFSTKYNSKGVGMGLYLSYDIVVNQLNGKISAKNCNNGAVFTIELPFSLKKY